MRPSSASASLRLAAPSFWMRATSSSVEISCWLVCCSVSMSTMERSASLTVAMVPIFRVSAFFFSSSLVISVTAFWAAVA